MKNIEVLKRRLERLETSLIKERARLTVVSNNIPWGAGMRRTKCTPSFAKENDLIERIEVLKEKIKDLEKL